jgi:hypothetical protein
MPLTRMLNFIENKIELNGFTQKELIALFNRDTLLPHLFFFKKLRSQFELQSAESHLYIHHLAIMSHKKAGQAYLFAQVINNPLKSFKKKYWRLINKIKKFLSDLLNSMSQEDRDNVYQYLRFLKKEIYNFEPMIIQALCAFYLYCKERRNPLLLYGLLDAASKAYQETPYASYYPDKLYTCPPGLEERIYLTCQSLQESLKEHEKESCYHQLYAEIASLVFVHPHKSMEMNNFLKGLCLAALGGPYQLEEKVVLEYYFNRLYTHDLLLILKKFNAEDHSNIIKILQFLAEPNSLLWTDFIDIIMDYFRGKGSEKTIKSLPQSIYAKTLLYLSDRGLSVLFDHHNKPIGLQSSVTGEIRFNVHDLDLRSLQALALEQYLSEHQVELMIKRIDDHRDVPEDIRSIIQSYWLNTRSVVRKNIVYQKSALQYDYIEQSETRLFELLRHEIAKMTHWPIQFIELAFMSLPYTRSEFIEQLRVLIDNKDDLCEDFDLFPFERLEEYAFDLLKQLDGLSLHIIQRWSSLLPHLTDDEKMNSLLQYSFLHLVHLTEQTPTYHELIERIDYGLFESSSQDNLTEYSLRLGSVSVPILSHILKRRRALLTSQEYENFQSKMMDYALTQHRYDLIVLLIKDQCLVYKKTIEILPKQYLDFCAQEITSIADVTVDREDRDALSDLLKHAITLKADSLLQAIIRLYPTCIELYPDIIFYVLDTGSLTVLRVLSDAGVDLNVKDTAGQTLLEKSYLINNIEIFNELLSLKVDSGFKELQDKNMLHTLFELRRFELADCLLTHTQGLLTRVDQDGFGALHYAVLARERDWVQLYKKHGADLDLKTSDGKTALYYAWLNRDCSMVSYCIENGSSIDIMVDDQPLILWAQATQDSIDTTEISLIERELAAIVMNTHDALPVDSLGITVSTTVVFSAYTQIPDRRKKTKHKD